jgi:hypothetical protein
MVNEGNRDDTCQFRPGTFEKIKIIINKNFLNVVTLQNIEEQA